MGALGAGIAAGGSLLSGVISGKGASSAAKAQAAAAQAGIQEQQREYDTSRADYAPFRDGGVSAQQQMLRLLGLGDVNTGKEVNGVTLSAEQQQQGALSNLQDSPLYQSLYNNGLRTVLNNASATGGLRGGNATSSLYNLGTDTFAQTLQNQLANLSGVANQGLSAVGGTTNAGLATSGNISSLLGQQGNANATATAAPYAGLASGLQGVASAYGNYTQSNQLSQLLSRLGGTSSTPPSVGSYGWAFGGF